MLAPLKKQPILYKGFLYYIYNTKGLSYSLFGKVAKAAKAAKAAKLSPSQGVGALDFQLSPLKSTNAFLNAFTRSNTLKQSDPKGHHAPQEHQSSKSPRDSEAVDRESESPRISPNTLPPTARQMPTLRKGTDYEEIGSGDRPIAVGQERCSRFATSRLQSDAPD